MNLKPTETMDRLGHSKKKVRKSYRRRSSMRMLIEDNVHTENSQREDYIEALRYLQNISEQKQVSLLNCILKGMMNQEAQEFLQMVWKLKQSKLGSKKFRNLINKAYPKYSFEQFQAENPFQNFSSFGDRYIKDSTKRRTLSCSERSTQDNEDITLHSKRALHLLVHPFQSGQQLGNHLRRKSCTCSYWGDPNLAPNHKVAMTLERPYFYVKEKVGWVFKI